MPLLHSVTQRNQKDFSSDVPSHAVLMWHQMQFFFWKIMVVVVFGPALICSSFSCVGIESCEILGFRCLAV